MPGPIWLIGVGGVAAAAALVAITSLLRQQHLAREALRLEADLAAARRTADDERSAAAAARAELRDTFASLSKDALKENRTEFRHDAETMLKPVRETLDRLQSHLVSVDKDREGAFRAVTTQLGQLSLAQEQLRMSTEGLSRALRSPNVRGRWGEIQLKRIVELAGMLEQCDFLEKESATSEGGRQTPDLVVKLPGAASIVVDAKVPIDAYLKAAAATDDAERNVWLAAHAKQVREHVRALGSKEYWKQFQPSPEFVVMFLPLEPLLSSAFEQDGSLLEFAATLRVIPATPMTLLAVLRAVAYGWQQQDLAKNAEEIRVLGRELYERLATMTGHLERVGLNIKSAADSYDRFIGSLEQSVLPSARRFRDLGVSSTKTIDSPAPLTLSVRRVKREELAGGRGEEPADAEIVEAESAMPLLEQD